MHRFLSAASHLPSTWRSPADCVRTERPTYNSPQTGELCCSQIRLFLPDNCSCFVRPYYCRTQAKPVIAGAFKRAPVSKIAAEEGIGTARIHVGVRIGRGDRLVDIAELVQLLP